MKNAVAYRYFPDLSHDVAHDLVDRTIQAIHESGEVALSTGLEYTLEDIAQYVWLQLPSDYALEGMTRRESIAAVIRVAEDAESGELFIKRA